MHLQYIIVWDNFGTLSLLLAAFDDFDVPQNQTFFTSPISQRTKRSLRNSFHVRAFSINERSKQQSRETCSCLAMYHGWTSLKFLAPNTATTTCDFGGCSRLLSSWYHDTSWFTVPITINMVIINIWSYVKIHYNDHQCYTPEAWSLL